MSERKAALPRDLKQKNYEAILRALADKKTFAVNQIADATKISRLTVAKAVESFIEHEIVIPAGKGSSTSVGGKKPKEYTLNPDRYVICISPAQQHLTFTLISLNGVVHDCIEMDFQARIMTASYQEYLKNTTDNIVMLVEKNHISPEQVLGVIACFGGIIDSQNGMIITSYPRHWGQNLPVVEDLKKLIPFPVKIYIENVSKVTASILMFDPEAADKKVAVVYTDYGTAITFLDNGMIPATRHHTSGEFGHICLEPDDEDVCDCGARGCLEVLISQRRISRLVDALDKKAKNALLADYKNDIDLRIYILQKENNPDAEKIRKYMANYLGLALRAVFLGIDPDYIMLMGIFAYAPDSFIEEVKKIIRENIYLACIDDIDIRKDKRDLTVLLNQGGINLVLKSIIENGE